MALSGLLLISLVSILSICGTTEYYVRPTEPSNTSCPAQPCLTLGQYVNNSDTYFTSNTVFKFLPGIHHLNRSLTVGNVQNISLESFPDISHEDPCLVAQGSCEAKAHDCIHIHERTEDLRVCCAAVWLHDVYNVTFEGISIAVQTPGVSGLLFKNASGLYVNAQVTMMYPTLGHICFGIAVITANSVEIHSSSVRKCSHGLVIFNATNSHITNIATMYSGEGLLLHTSINTYITNTTANNGQSGMHLNNMNNTYITNITAKYNMWSGVRLHHSCNTIMYNTKTTHNDVNGMDFYNMSNTYIISSTSVLNSGYGMVLRRMRNTTVINTYVSHNAWDGMVLSTLSNTHITNTTAKHNYQHGIFLRYMNETIITNTSVTHNAQVGLLVFNSNNTYITNVTAKNNGMARQYYGTLCVMNGEINIYYSIQTLIYSSSFTDTTAPSATNTADPNTQPAVIALYNSTLNVSICHFARNSISAVKAFASTIRVSGYLMFSGNTAVAGTAFILIQNSILSLSENSHIYFSNNFASTIGGVFYISTSVLYFVNHMSALPRNTCFLSTQGSRSQTRFTFVNNSAGMGGDILFGGQVALGLDGDWNCLESFRNISNISQNGLSLISSNPSRVCFCNESGQPDCLMVVPPVQSIYPGQTVNVSIVVVGQNFGTVAGSVFAQFLHKSLTESLPQLESSQYIKGVTQYNCSTIRYTIFSQQDVSEAVLILTAYSSHVSNLLKNKEDYDMQLLEQLRKFYHTPALEPLIFIDYPVYNNFTLLPCPPGFTLTTHPPFKCDCNQLLQRIRAVQCHIQTQTFGRSGLVWVGTMQDKNTTVAVSEYCSLDYCNAADSNVTLDDPDSQCNYKHSGILCGGCKPGLSVALGTAQCLECSNTYLVLFVPFALAGPVLLFFIKFLDFTVSQGTINGLIFFANIVKANEYIFIPWRQAHPLTLFIAWLNLDLGVETCLFQGLTAYSKTWLQFVFPVYIWSVAGVIIVLARYSNTVAKVMGNNSVPVLATLFLLSYAKLFRTIIAALSYTMLYTSQGDKAVWTADGNLDYLGPKHTPLFFTAVAVLLFLWLPYTLFLFLGQWLHLCNCFLINRMMIKLKPFLDAHYGPLKGKHRYWFGALLLVRATILLISALVPANHSSVVVECTLVLAIVLTFFGQMVYRNIAVSVFDTSFFMNLALLAGTNKFARSAGDMSVSAYVLIGLVFAQFVGLVLFKVFSIFKKCDKMMKCLHKKYPVEDDWELYEEAALQREMECDMQNMNSDTDDTEDKGCGSIESLPTY